MPRMRAAASAAGDVARAVAPGQERGRRGSGSRRSPAAGHSPSNKQPGDPLTPDYRAAPRRQWCHNKSDSPTVPHGGLQGFASRRQGPFSKGTPGEGRGFPQARRHGPSS